MKKALKLTIVAILVLLFSALFLTSCETLQQFCSHEWGEWQTTLEPTCQDVGSRERTCSKCGAIDDEDISEIEHEAMWVTVTEATCEEQGEKTLICKNCENTLDVQKIPSMGHHQSDLITVDPTCGSAGYTRTECTTCGMEMSCEYFGEPTYEHISGNWIVDEKPTCHSFGSKHKECTVCHQEVDWISIDASAHTYNDDNCTVCGATHEKYFLLGDDAYKGVVKANPDYTLPERIVIPAILYGKLIERVESFKDCTTIKEVVLGEDVVGINSYAFQNCKNLKKISIPSSVKEIEEYTFSGCTSLVEITASNVEDIGDHAFEYCESLTELSILDSAANIGEYAFSGCTGVKKLILDTNIKKIGRGSFANCNTLTEVVIADSIEEIGAYTFYGCEKLSNIEIVDIEDVSLGGILLFRFYIGSIGRGVFSGTAYYENEDNWEDGALYIGDYLFDVKTDVSGAFDIKDGVITMADYAFYDCNQITGVTVPSSLLTVSAHAFFNCTSLTQVTLNEGVRKIGYSAFEKCSKLESVNLPKSIEYIGKYAFFDCSKLSEVVFGNTENWYTNTSDDSVALLSDPAIAAKYLRDTYRECEWYFSKD